MDAQQCGGDLVCEFGIVVVADPGFEQVAEYVERVRAACFFSQKAREQFRDRGPLRIQMQIGYEQRGHGQGEGRVRKGSSSQGRRRRWGHGAPIAQSMRP
jgi:hypothetical protein